MGDKFSWTAEHSLERNVVPQTADDRITTLDEVLDLLLPTVIDLTADQLNQCMVPYLFVHPGSGANQGPDPNVPFHQLGNHQPTGRATRSQYQYLHDSSSFPNTIFTLGTVQQPNSCAYEKTVMDA